MDNRITTSLTNKVEEQVKSECMAEGFDFQLIKKISLSENSEPTPNMLAEVIDVLDQSKLSLTVIASAVENGLELKNVARAFEALDYLNGKKKHEKKINELINEISNLREKNPDDPSIQELEKKIAKLETAQEKKDGLPDRFSLVSNISSMKEYIKKKGVTTEGLSHSSQVLSIHDAAHKTNCATIEEELLNRFINTFRLEDGKAINKAIAEVYKYGNHDRVDIAIETALKTNDALEDHNKGLITECLNVMKEDCTKTRQIANAPKTRNTGVTGDDNTRIPHKDEAYRDKNKM